MSAVTERPSAIADSRTARSASACGRCARRWASRCATSPSAAGSSAPMLSQVERGETSPTLAVAAQDRRRARAQPLAAAAPRRGRARRRSAAPASRRRCAARRPPLEELTPPLPGQRADVSLHTLEPGAATGGPRRPAAARAGQPRDRGRARPAPLALVVDGERHELRERRQRHLRRRPAAPLRERRRRSRPGSSPWSPPA